MQSDLRIQTIIQPGGTLMNDIRIRCISLTVDLS